MAVEIQVRRDGRKCWRWDVLMPGTWVSLDRGITQSRREALREARKAATGIGEVAAVGTM